MDPISPRCIGARSRTSTGCCRARPSEIYRSSVRRSSTSSSTSRQPRRLDWRSPNRSWSAPITSFTDGPSPASRGARDVDACIDVTPPRESGAPFAGTIVGVAALLTGAEVVVGGWHGDGEAERDVIADVPDVVHGAAGNPDD